MREIVYINLEGRWSWRWFILRIYKFCQQTVINCGQRCGS